jgi:hypothetical protein
MVATVGNRLTLDPMGKCSNALLAMFEASRAVSFWPKQSESYLEMEKLLRDKLVYINVHIDF